MSTLVGMSPATPADLTGAKVKKKVRCLLISLVSLQQPVLTPRSIMFQYLQYFQFAGYGDVVWNGEVVQMVGKGMFRVYWFDGEGNGESKTQKRVQSRAVASLRHTQMYN